jgi:hypothetical protein
MLLAQTLGVLAFAIGLTSYQFKSQRRLFQLNMLTDALWILHYILLGAWPVVFAVSVSILRTASGVFLWPQHKMQIALGAFVVITLFTILFPPENPVGWLVIVTGAIYSATVAFHQNYVISRSLMFAGSLMWIVIGIGYGSVGEIIASVFSASSILVAAWRHNRLKINGRTGRAETPTPQN